MPKPVIYAARLRALCAATALLLTACSGNDQQAGGRSNSATPPPSRMLTVFYTKPDGQSLGTFRVAMTKPEAVESEAYLATISSLVGPPSSVAAIRFPVGTNPRSVNVTGHIVTVDLSDEVKKTAAGGVTEGAVFKALVWTLTNLPGISQVEIRVHGATLPTLPGGHFELDEPLSRTDW